MTTPTKEQVPFNLESALRTGITLVGTRQCGKTTLANYFTDLLIEKGILVYVIDPTRAWMTRRHDLHVLSIPQPTRYSDQLSWEFENTLFDVSRLSTFDQQSFCELFCKTMLGTVIDLQDNGTHTPQIWVWFEEAHTPMPLWAFSGKRLPETGRLITQGANFGISFGLITQFAAMVAKLPVKATQQRYFGLTSEPNDIKYLRSFIGKEWSEQLRGLDVGEFIYNAGNTIKRFQHKPQQEEMVYQYSNRKTESLREISPPVFH
jgi:hypothetical protein